MYTATAECVARATGEVLISPDWSATLELCDIINRTPGQAKYGLKIIKKKLGSKRPMIQLLALSVLDALIKNCGEIIIQQIIEQEILLEMVKMVKTKPNKSVKENVLILIDTWQEAFGVRFPQFFQTFCSLRDIGIEFPHREESSITLYTPSQPQVQQSSNSLNYTEAAVQASLEYNISHISTSEMQTAQELAEVLKEMLDALDSTNSEAINQELIVELAEQCQAYQKRVQSLVNNDTFDESLLFQGFAVNEKLQRILRRHEEIAKGITFTNSVKPESSASQFTGVCHLEDKAEDNFSHLAPRSRARSLAFSNEPASLARVLDPSHPASWEQQATTSLPHPPTTNEGTSDNLFISRHSTPSRDKESEDALFRNLVDFVKARESPSSSATKSNRSY